MKNYFKYFVIIVILIIGSLLFILSHQINGWRTFIVTSGSMEPTIKTGSLVLSQRVNPDTLQKNDIITFVPPLTQREFVTHRISQITQKNSLRIFHTKGDNNKRADAWLLASGRIVGKVIYSIPYLGYIFSFTQTKLGLLLFILIPAVFIIIEEIRVIFRIIKTHTKPTTQNQELLGLFLFFFLQFFSLVPRPSLALISDRAFLTNNYFVFTKHSYKNVPTCKKDKDKNENRQKDVHEEENEELKNPNCA